MSPCLTCSATQSTPSGFMLEAVHIIQGVSPEWLIYQQEVCVYMLYNLSYSYSICTTQAPPTPTGVTTEDINASSVRVAWQWTSSGPAPNCFNITRVTYHPEGGDEFSLQLSDPAVTETTLTDLQCNTNYTITVVATAGEHRREGNVFIQMQGKPHIQILSNAT